MARQTLFVRAAVVLAFLLPLVAARPGGRLCRTSFFFPDPNNVRTVTLVGDINGAPAGFKLFSVSSSGFLRSSSNLLEVRLHNLHRQMLLNPALSHALDLDLQPSKPFVEQPTRSQIVQTWSFSTSNPRRPITWIDIRSRRALWRPDVNIPHVEQKPLSLDIDSSLWLFVLSFAFGFTFFFAAVGLVRALLRNCFMCSHEDEDAGFLLGYQELPSSEASEKEVAQKEFAKEIATKAENV